MNKEKSVDKYNEIVTRAVRLQIKELENLEKRIDESFSHAITLILQCQGRIIISGMGKSGIIGKKMASTFTSTGTDSFFMHPGEAFHGDLGMIRAGEYADLVIFLSNSGETDEILQLIPSLKELNSQMIAITGKTNSTLAKHADIVLDSSVEQEACPNNLAPTCSTTVAMVIADALAYALMIERNFKPQDFAKLHPGGTLGKRLLTNVEDVMVHKNLPIVSRSSPTDQVIFTMTASRMGIALVMDNKILIGIITDGDLRRFLSKDTNLSGVTAGDLMTANPICISGETRLADAEALMRKRRVKCLVVVNQKNQVIGLLDWAE